MLISAILWLYNGNMNSTSDRQIFSVSELNRTVRHLLETQLPLLWVEGQLRSPRSGMVPDPER